VLKLGTWRYKNWCQGSLYPTYTDAIDSTMSAFYSICEIIFGHYLIIGNYEFRHFFIEALVFILSLQCKIAIFVISFTQKYFDDTLYNSVISIYSTIPYNTYAHFRMYPELYVYAGWTMIVVGLVNTIHHLRNNKQ